MFFTRKNTLEDAIAALEASAGDTYPARYQPFAILRTGSLTLDSILPLVPRGSSPTEAYLGSRRAAAGVLPPALRGRGRADAGRHRSSIVREGLAMAQPGRSACRFAGGRRGALNWPSSPAGRLGLAARSSEH